MQALMNMDYKEKSILASGFITSVLAWKEVARIDNIFSLINRATYHCCNEWGYANLKTCSLYVVKTFGPGISISSPQTGYCIESIFKKLSSHYNVQNAFHVITGLIGTATVISMLIKIGKRTFYRDEDFICKDDPCCNQNVCEGAKNIGLFISFTSLLVNQYVSLIFSIMQKTDSDSLYSKCCDWDRTYPKIPNCISAIEYVYGYGLNFSNYPDLCGGNVLIAKENSNSSLINTALIMAAIGISAFGLIIKVSRDTCTSQDSNNVTKQNDGTNDVDVELSSSSKSQNEDLVDLSSDENFKSSN